MSFFKKLFRWNDEKHPFEIFDERGFNIYGDHLNGTRYDDTGFDVRGFNKDGKTANRKYYDERGFDAKGIHLM